MSFDQSISLIFFLVTLLITQSGIILNHSSRTTQSLGFFFFFSFFFHFLCHHHYKTKSGNSLTCNSKTRRTIYPFYFQSKSTVKFPQCLTHILGKLRVKPILNGTSQRPNSILCCLIGLQFTRYVKKKKKTQTFSSVCALLTSKSQVHAVNDTMRIKKRTPLGLWAVFLVLFSLLVYESKGLNVEGQHLLDIKRSLVDIFGHLRNWNSSDSTPCGWEGVLCSNNYYADSEPAVLCLDLNSMNLSGSLSPSIGGLARLTELDVSFNALSGQIPGEIGNVRSLEVLRLNNNEFEGLIPAELGKLSSLTLLNLCNNRLSGPFPEELANLSLLTQLIAYTNNISGPLPSSFGRLRSLVTFRAGQNAITGSLPANIGECSNLMFLGLAQNQLSGDIPEGIGKLKNLTGVVLFENQLSGIIPKELGNCTNLETLALYKNNLGGEIPKEFGNLVYLSKLYLYRNELNGTIPREIGNLSSAVEIDFSENLLSGEIPVEFSRIPGLRLLHLFGNRLQGLVPSELAGLKNLTRLDLSINLLTGPIPVGFQYLTKLTMLQLFENSLSGIIPPALGLYSLLWVLDLSDNRLTGRIPRHLCQYSNLILLNLDSNRLNGNIPPGITSCKSLVQLRLAGNNITGNFPAELCKLVNLSAVELEQNKFSGTIPSEIGNCRALQRLLLGNNRFNGELPREIGKLSELVIFNVSSNSLSGRIPPELFGCSMLQRLDLSRNNFVDGLPSEIGTLSHLELFKLSDNNLSGSIPVSLGSLVRLTELQMGGNSFSGSIPGKLGSLSSLQIALNLSYNNLSGEIPPELGSLVLLEYLLLNNNHLVGEIPKSFDSLSSLLGCNFSYNELSGPLPDLPLFKNMKLSSYVGNQGLCGGPLGECKAPPSPLNIPSDARNKRARIGKTIAVVAASVGGAALVLIAVIVYVMTHPVDVVTPLQDNKPLTPLVSDIYFSPKEGFTFQDLVDATENFHDRFVIGRGAWGTVYKAVLWNDHTIAVKKLASNREGNSADTSFHAEIETLGKIRHRNIVKLYGFCYHQGTNLLLYEYMSRGSLGELLHGSGGSAASAGGLGWRTRFVIALGAAQGLAYLHHDCKPRIVHRDIKSNNILLHHNFEARVGDFGLAKLIDMPQSKSMSAVAGSYGYIAPEYAYTMKVTEKCDIYSYGVVLLELLTGKTPVQAVDQGGDLVTWVRSYVKKHNMSPTILDSRLNLVEGEENCNTVSHMIIVLKIALLCTNLSPLERPTMREVVSMLIESNNLEGHLDLSPTTTHNVTN